ncbi:MAG TPA: hypothetical protein V6C46_10985 [Coleofasciculaceae cyanobacterium]
MKRRWVRLMTLILGGAIAVLAFTPPGMELPPLQSAPPPVPVQSPGSSNQSPPASVTSPSLTPTGPSDFPKIPVVSPKPQAIPLPASSAAPFPLQPSPYQDPGGRFRVGILQGYSVSPLAGSVLIESPSGGLAYTVVAQAQPMNNPISPQFQTEGDIDLLANAATAVFQRGEGFQPGPARLEAGGGIVMDWTGTLTIGGQSQPVGGVILVRSSLRSILIALIAATQAGGAQVPAATAALATSLEIL